MNRMDGDTMAKSLCEQIIDAFSDNDFRQKAESANDAKHDPHLWFQGLQYPTEFEESDRRWQYELNEVFGKMQAQDLVLRNRTPGISYTFLSTIDGVRYKISIVNVKHSKDGNPIFEVQFTLDSDNPDEDVYKTVNKFHIVTTLATVAKAMEKANDMAFEDMEGITGAGYAFVGLGGDQSDDGIDKRLRVYNKIVPRIIDSGQFFKGYDSEFAANQKDEDGTVYSIITVEPKEKEELDEMLGRAEPEKFELIDKSKMMGFDSYKFQTEIDGIRYDIKFGQVGRKNDGGPIFVVTFSVHSDDLSKVDGKGALTNKYQVNTILATVVATMGEVIKDTLSNVKPTVHFKYQGANEEDESEDSGMNKRMKVYDRLIPRIIENNPVFQEHKIEYNSGVDDHGEHYTIISVLPNFNESEILDYKFRKILFS